MTRRTRPSLLLSAALAFTLTGVAHGVGVVEAAKTPPAGPPAAPPTRLGVSIAKDAVARDEAAAGRSRSLDLREQAARATEERIKADLAGRAGASSTKNPSDGGEQFDSLARVYQAMKPANAARVFEKLDMSVQMQIAGRMRERSTAMILASMTPQAATDLSMALARKSAALPAPPAPPALAAAAPAPAPPPAESVKPTSPRP